MGEKLFFYCNRCQKEYTLTYHYSPFHEIEDEQLIDDIMGGKYGEEIKQYYSDGKTQLHSVRSQPYICKCGYFKTYRENRFIGRDEPIEFSYDPPTHRCPKCKKKMHEIKEPMK